MYKSKLQELCHKKKWAPPRYTCIKDGEDHCPLFKAAVVVGGATFDAVDASKSSKHAYNEAAKVAFLHFTSGCPEPPNEETEGVEKTNSKEQVQSSNPHSEDYVAVIQDTNLDLQEQFKKKLEMYARRKNLDSPVYSTEKEGICFRCRVSIGQNWFHSRELCQTTEEAQNTAAQAALLSLSTDAFHENDQCSYENLIQELTESDEGFFFPTYTTIKSDNPRHQTFSSTLEINGEVFQGATAKSKKLAELNAAKAAYTVLMDRKLFQPGYIAAPQPSSDEIFKLAPDLASVTISDPQEKPEPEKKCYLLCNRFKIFTCMPNMALPEGGVVLPISEDRWTMVNLEFPREKVV